MLIAGVLSAGAWIAMEPGMKPPVPARSRAVEGAPEAACDTESAPSTKASKAREGGGPEGAAQASSGACAKR